MENLNPQDNPDQMVQNLMRPLFYFGYSIVFAFAALKITHISVTFDKEIALAGFIAISAFILMALIEIYRSKNIPLAEKIMWTAGFLFLNLITGLIYFLLGRKRVIRSRRESPYVE